MSDMGAFGAATQAASSQTDQNKENVEHRKVRTGNQTNRRPTSGASVLSIGSGLACASPAPGDKKQHRLKSRFTVIRKLGKGTYGKVQLAVNKETGQEVAIKTIKKTKIENEQDLQRVRREIQIMSSIEHPHIIHIYEVFENKDKIVLIMQYAPGGELYEYVSQSRALDDGEARRLFRQIATAIYYCHQNKICHRDLKLENILLDEKNNAKIADFGLSNVFDKRRQLSTFCGSPLYASPEIVQGSPYEGPEVDCWSLGVLLYTLVYGAMPFDGSNFKRLVKQISEATYYEPKQRSQASPLINRLLCADPNQRATILDICSDPWVNSAASPSVPASPSKVSPSNVGPAGQHPSLLKVAQDMANLTPVRVDILLALTPAVAAPEQPPVATLEAAPKPQASRPNRHNPTIALDASLMEVDENRSTSPVANYIVRNLDDTQADKPVVETNNVDLSPRSDKLPEAEETQQVSDSRSQHQEIPDYEVQTAIEATKEPVAMEQKTPEGIVQTTDMQTGDETPAEVVKMEAQEDNAKQPEEQEKTSMEVEVEVETTEPEDMTITTTAPMEVAEEAKEDGAREDAPQVADTTVQPEPAEEEPKEEPRDEPKEAQKDEKSQEQKEDQREDQKEATENEEKPKTKKKKIVIVKKKRKVVKRDADQTDENATTTDDKTTSSKQDEQQAPKSPSNKGPVGKVRIPETFQPGEEPEQPLQRASATSRRQSALIADVSQKLIQQHQQHLDGTTSTGGAIDADQPQLTNVRVSDKKSEFERRASQLAAAELVASKESSSSPCKLESGTMGEKREPESTPVCVLGSRESLSFANKVEQTIVEPIDRMQPLQTQPPVALRPPGVPSEPLTPTEATLSPLDVTKRLSECADRLRTETRSPNSLEAIRDDRSDSVDTIRAELMSLDSPEQPSRPSNGNIRSSLQINLSGLQQQQPVTPARGSIHTGSASSMIVGPTPITRSYKKVTFTKDGTCVTETGRIYSTQADDGTVRRVERKSKVTHYPGEASSSSSGGVKEASEETHEEVVFEGGSGQASSFRSSSKRGLPFERLIMPSADLFPSGQDYSDQEDMERQNAFGPRKQSPFESRRSSYGQQRGRADSASSCSSGSTDVFDDTFDTWTGAISMFNQSRRISELHNSLISRAFGGSPLPLSESIFSKRGGSSSGRINRRPQSGPFGAFPSHQSGGSTTARCESVEPDARGHRRGHSRRRNGSERARDGYESDVAFDERPASSLGGARGRTFGSSNLFPRAREVQADNENDDDPFESFVQKQSGLFAGDSLFEDLQMEHERLKQRLSQRHKQIWMGSSPSLHQASRHEQHQSSATTTTTSNSNIRPSVPLSAAPTRRNTASLAGEELPPRQAARRSTSRTSLITSQMANVQLGSGGSSSSCADNRTKQHHVASFIELKRTPSNLHNQEQSQANVATSAGSTSASFWNERATPTGSLMSSGGSRLHSLHDQHPDARIHSWLQQSTGNLSISSGSKSSASDTIASSVSRSDQAMFVPIQPEDSLSTLGGSNMRLPPPAPSRSPNRHVQVQRAQHFSTSSSVVRSSSRQSIEGEQRQQQFVESCSRQELQEKQQQQTSKAHLLSQTSSATKVSREVFSFASSKPPRLAERQHYDDVEALDDWPKPFQQQKLQATSTSSGSQRVSPSTAPTSGRNVDGLQWRHTESSSSGLSRLLSGPGDEPDGDSLTGSAADLESRSSSSLLDQLRSRGYRSMINQRLQPVISEASVAEQQLSSQVVSSTSSSGHHHQQQTSSRSFVTSTTTMTMSSSKVAPNHDEVSSSSSRSSPHQPGRQLDEAKQLQESDSCNGDQDNHLENDLQKQLVANDSNIAVERPQERVERNQLAQPNGKSHEPACGDLSNSAIKEQPAAEICNGATTNEAKETKLDDVDDDDMDEDVREAKANIKEYLDRMRETDKFIKSMQAEEENLERQRQELFLFNQVLLNRKLNGIRGASQASLGTQALDGPHTASMDNHQATWLESSNRLGPRSAPVWTDFGSGAAPTDNAYLTSKICNHQQHQEFATPTTTSAFSCFSSDLYRPVASQDPYLEPVQPLYLSAQTPAFRSHSPGGAWRRSKSQLGDQFSNCLGSLSATCSSYNPRTTSRRPLSATIDPLSMETNPYFPSAAARHRRSVSQMRTPSLSLGTNKYQGPVMSEYRSAFGAPRRQESPVRRTQSTGLRPGKADDSDGHQDDDHYDANRNHNQNDDDDDDDDDDQMASYRAHSYVPRVVPEGGPRGRDFSRRYSASKAPHLLAPSRARVDSTSPVLSPIRQSSNKPYNERRTSLQLSSSSLSQRPSREVEPDRSKSPLIRRRSLTATGERDTDNGVKQVGPGENSRLSELEQRIQANKRRREELLSGASIEASSSSSLLTTKDRQLNKAAQPNGTASRDDQHDDDEEPVVDAFERPSRGPSGDTPATKEPPTPARPGTRPRPSRLESMEARIKRRSYCVRMASPERPARSRPLAGQQTRQTKPATPGD